MNYRNGYDTAAYRDGLPTARGVYNAIYRNQRLTWLLLEQRKAAVLNERYDAVADIDIALHDFEEQFDWLVSGWLRLGGNPNVVRNAIRSHHMRQQLTSRLFDLNDRINNRTPNEFGKQQRAWEMW